MPEGDLRLSMALQLSAIDAVIGGIAPAFFGGLLAGGAYLLNQHLQLREQVIGMATRLERLQAVEQLVTVAGDASAAAMAKLLNDSDLKEG